MTVLPADKYTFLLEAALKHKGVRTAEGSSTVQDWLVGLRARSGWVPTAGPSLTRIDEQLLVGARAAVFPMSPFEVKRSGWVSPSFGDVAKG